MTRSAKIAAFVLAVLAFALYARTAASDLTLVDSAELSLACATGSVPHPPGFPLYFLLGRAACLLSPLPPIRTTTLLSALCIAMSVGFVFLCVDRMIATLTALAGKGARVSGAGGAFGRESAAALAAIAWGTSRNAWTWAGVTEVYALNVMLLAAAWAAAWAGAEKIASKSGPGRRELIVAAISAALGLANHHATAAVAWMPLLALAVTLAPKMLGDRRFMTGVVLAIAGSLALYLVLIPAGRAERGFDWGGVRDLSLLVRHVEGRQYHVQFGSDVAGAKYVFREFLSALALDPGIPATLCFLVGVPLALLALRSSRSSRPVVAFFATAFAANFALSMAYAVGPEDRVAYDLPAHVALCVGAGLGFWGILARLGDGSARRALLTAAGAALLVGVWNVRRNFEICDFQGERVARTFVEESFRDVPDGSVVFIAEWNLAAPLFYMQAVEGWRPNLRVIDILMLRRFWYLGTIERTLPELAEGSRAEFDAFRDQVTRFDLGRPYDQARIQPLYENLLRKWAQLGAESGGAYFDWACAMRPDEAGWVRSMMTAPDGLLVRIDDSKAMDAANPFTRPQRPVGAMDAANLSLLRSKFAKSGIRLDLTSIVARHVQYWKVFSAYATAVEGSMLYALLQGDEPQALALRQSYSAWFPDIDATWASARRRAGISP